MPSDTGIPAFLPLALAATTLPKGTLARYGNGAHIHHDAEFMCILTAEFLSRPLHGPASLVGIQVVVAVVRSGTEQRLHCFISDEIRPDGRQQFLHGQRGVVINGFADGCKRIYGRGKAHHVEKGRIKAAGNGPVGMNIRTGSKAKIMQDGGQRPRQSAWPCAVDQALHGQMRAVEGWSAAADTR